MHWANRYITSEVPFVDKGRDPEVGLDCYGLVRWVYREEFGIELPSYVDDYEDLHDNEALQTLYDIETAKWDEVKSPRDFDVAWGQIIRQGTHCGIYVAPGKLLHIAEAPGVQIVRLGGPEWRHRIRHYYRHPQTL